MKAGKKIILILILLAILGIYLLSYFALTTIINITTDKIPVDYEIKSGTIKRVYTKDEDSKYCEYIIVDDYEIFIQCNKKDTVSHKAGEPKEYFFYKNKAYNTKDQMIAETTKGKIQTILSIIALTAPAVLIVAFSDKIFKLIGKLTQNKD